MTRYAEYHLFCIQTSNASDIAVDLRGAEALAPAATGVNDEPAAVCRWTVVDGDADGDFDVQIASKL